MAGSSNFLQWGPSSNIETDSQYSSDAIRQSGATAGAIFSSELANKAFLQWSTMVAALGQMLATKGYTVSDANLNQLATVLGAIVTQADLPTPLISQAYASTLAFNATSVRGWDITLTGNVTSSTLTNIAPGQDLKFVLRQDSVGGRVFSWPSQINGPQPDPAANAVSIISFFVAIDGSIRPLTTMTVS